MQVADSVRAAEAENTATVSPARSGLLQRQVEVGLWSALALVVLAVASVLRFAAIDQVPRFTDETDVIVRALAIAGGEIRPLTDTDAYIGAGFSYVVATVLTMFGPGPVLPRYVVATAGVLTVLATFMLAGEVSALTRNRSERGAAWSRPDLAVGLLAATILAVSPVHVVVNSRIAWSHCTTPLFTTLTLALLARAVRRGQPALLPAAGLVAGFGLQTHPTVVPFLLGSLAWLLLAGRRLLTSRWLLLAVLLGGIGCANLIAYNLLTGFDSVQDALDKAGAYDVEQGGRASYFDALQLEAAGLARLLAGAIGTRRGDEVPLSPTVVGWAVAMMAAVVYATRRGATIVPLVVAPFLLLLPMLNAKFDPLFNGRYLMPIVPLVAAAWAITIVALSGRLSVRRTVAIPVAAVAIVITLALPIWSLVAFGQASLGQGGNEVYESLAQRVREARRPGELVLLDSGLGGERVASGRQGVSVVEYFLLLGPDQPTTLVGDVGELSTYLETHHDNALLVLLPNARRRLGTQFDMTTVGEAPRRQQENIANAGLFRATLRDE